MKNNALLLMAAGVLALASCGTSSYTANNNGGYKNSIYYSGEPGAANQTYTTTSEKSENTDVKGLQSRTNYALNSSKARNIFGTGSNSKTVDTIYVGDTNVVNINYDPNVDYAIVDSTESYEERLRKFDSPSYTVNIQYDDPWDYNYYNPFWAYNYGWYRPYGITWGVGWYNPWWGMYYSWSPSWGWGWDPWYYGYGWGFNWGWGGFGWGWDPWYYGYGRGWGYGYGQGDWGPGSRSWNDRYYARRDGVNEYGNRSGRGVGAYGDNAGGNRSVGSAYRKDPTMGVIRGNNGGVVTTSGRNGSSYRGTGTYGGNKNGNTNGNFNGTRNGNVGVYSGNRSNNGNNGSSYRNGTVSNNGAVYSNGAANSGYNNRNGNIRGTGAYGGNRSSNSMYRQPQQNSNQNSGNYRTSPSRNVFGSSSRNSNGGSSYRSSSSYSNSGSTYSGSRSSSPSYSGGSSSGGGNSGGNHSSGGSYNGGGHSGGSSTRR